MLQCTVAATDQGFPNPPKAATSRFPHCLLASMSALADDNSGDAVSSSLNLMRRLPPSRIAQNVSGLVSLTPRDADELLQRLDRKWWCGARTHLAFGVRPVFLAQRVGAGPSSSG